MFSLICTVVFLYIDCGKKIAAVLTHPFDVAKTIQQIAQETPLTTSQQSRMLMLHIFRQIVRQEGLRGLFRGLSPRIAKVAPACGIMISSYEVGKRFFETRNSSSSSVVAT